MESFVDIVDVEIKLVGNTKFEFVPSDVTRNKKDCKQRKLLAISNETVIKR